MSMETIAKAKDHSGIFAKMDESKYLNYGNFYKIFVPDMTLNYLNIF